MHNFIAESKAERGYTSFDDDMTDRLKVFKCKCCNASQTGTDENVVSCCKDPRIEDEFGNVVTPWSVPVMKKKSPKKKSANQRRAAARGRKVAPGFAGVIEEDGPVSMCTADVEWVKLELAVDSGAAETICPGAQAPDVPTVPGQKMAQGERYTCAGGKTIPNLGEKRLLMCTEESATEHRLTMQVADVNRALMFVSRAVDAGSRIVFDEGWSYIEDKRTGRRTTIQRQGRLYVLEAWVKARDEAPAQPFGRQGGNQ